MLIEDSSKDNYKQNSEQFDHKCTYIIHKCILTNYTMTAWSRKTRRCTVGGACLSCCYEYCRHA